jgi:hypothetical protein
LRDLVSLSPLILRSRRKAASRRGGRGRGPREAREGEGAGAHRREASPSPPIAAHWAPPLPPLRDAALRRLLRIRGEREKRTFNAIRRCIGAALLLALGGCGSVEPFDSLPRLPGKVLLTESDRVGVCYNGFFTTPDRVRAIAVESCGPGMTPVLLGQDMRFACPMMTPIRATFQCTPD